jgi:Outer membrane protein and related peptidoglycan-associated (lipo)proteins
MGSVLFLPAQTLTAQSERKENSKAWELGIGGSVFQFSRTSFSNFSKLDDGYNFDLRLSHTVWGGNIYVARELNSHFYVDLQGTAGFTNESLGNEDKNKWFYMVGPGLQWRLGEYFGSKYVDPYIRAGINYMYKDFSILYKGQEGLSPDEMTWIMENFKNKEGVDRKHLMPIAVGGGLNTWLNDNIGIGFQADYLIMPYKHVANSMQGTVRLMWRIGGESKKSSLEIQYVEVEKVVEKIVEKPVVVEKVVETPVREEIEMVCDFFNNIDFEFNEANLTSASEKAVSEIASIMKKDTSRKYLITGYTDSKGSSQYNMELSRKRAAAVVNALVGRGVSQSMLKSRGVGDKISYIKSGASDIVRKGDRKVTVELITNMDYWNNIPNN